MTDRIDLLDHGYIRLVESMGTDLSITRAARVSYNADWRAGEDAGSDAKLIRYLWNHKHTSPFEAVTATFEVQAPIFVFRQWHRHRTQCIGANAKLAFNRPCDGKAYPMPISDVVRKWNASSPERQRHDRTLADFNRDRLGSMLLRAPGGDVHLTDAWYSGEKILYEVRTENGSIEVSENHLFKTPNGSARLIDGLTEVMMMRSVGAARNHETPIFSEQELAHEEWREIADGYDISSLGQVRSWWGQGARIKRSSPIMKAQTMNAQGRAVVSIEGAAIQVSHLVCAAFIGEREGNPVLHFDDNPANNRAMNLYVGTPMQNVADQYVNGGRRRLRETPVKVLGVRKLGMLDSFDASVTGDHWFCARSDGAADFVIHNSYNEVSARYTELPELFYVPEPAVIGVQSTSNKQGRQESAVPFDQRATESSMLRRTCQDAFATYRYLLGAGWPRELARGVLPFNTYSRMFATANLLNWFRFMTLRCDPHAQHEIRVYADAMRELLRPIVPVALAAWESTDGSRAA